MTRQETVDMNIFDKIFGENGCIQERKSDYVPRESQINAALKIYDAFKNKQHFVLEGPCGFGKTFAYLVPLFEAIRGTKKKAIVVTDGISLQEQLANKDIPFVNDIFESLSKTEIDFAILKGKGNFVCLRKYDLFADTGKRGEQVEALLAWMQGSPKQKRTITGDFAELDVKLNPELHSEVSCAKEGECEGKNCSRYVVCYYRTHKERALVSDIIITNYHILFSDWKIGQGKLLPKYDFAIFDEAHEFASKFKDFRMSKFSVQNAKYLKMDIRNLIDEHKMLNMFLMDSDKLETAFDCSITLNNITEKYFEDIFTLNFKNDSHTESRIIEKGTFLKDEVRKNLVEILNDIALNLEEVQNCAAQYSARCLTEGTDKHIECQSYIRNIGNMQRRIAEFIKILCNCDKAFNDSSKVYWIEKSADYKRLLSPAQRISICFKPIDISDDIKKSFLEREDVSCVFTSATMSTNGNFDFIKRQIGLNKCPSERVLEFIGDSPFDLREQQFWYLPENSKSAKDSEFLNGLPDQIEGLVRACKGGVLCLFTSNANMKYCYNDLKPKIEFKYGVTSLIQGEKSQNKLIEEFTNDVDSVLFATKTFFTN